ncbi:MAG: DUF1990 domain-containing protein [Caldilineaceae bacterium]
MSIDFLGMAEAEGVISMVQVQRPVHQEKARQFYLRPVSKAEIDHFLAAQVSLSFSYAAVGASQGAPPGGSTVDHNRVQLGSGLTVYDQACAALQRWEMFNLGWVKLCWPDQPLQPGVTVGVVAQLWGVQILNACRIVYTFDESTEEGKRFGFAYGTLPGHIERGEERFQIEWRRRDDSVWYDILAFSQPAHWLAHLGYPVTRFFQKRFARHSKAAMERSIHEH